MVHRQSNFCQETILVRDTPGVTLADKLRSNSTCRMNEEKLPFSPRPLRLVGIGFLHYTRRGLRTQSAWRIVSSLSSRCQTAFNLCKPLECHRGSWVNVFGVHSPINLTTSPIFALVSSGNLSFLLSCFTHLRHFSGSFDLASGLISLIHCHCINHNHFVPPAVWPILKYTG